MLNRFPPPRPGEVSVSTRFSTDTAWLGEQVELVTAAWFPRELRDRLRRPPTLRSPSLSGLWSVQSQSTPALAATRFVGGQVYDLFVAHQTLFPLGEGTIQAPPATLSFAVPTSRSYFAPEARRTLSSRSVTLVVRPIPANLASVLAGGPTANNLTLVWRAPVEGLVAGTPALVELVVRGEGNLTLWPVPAFAWPPGVRVYAERTDERSLSAGGKLSGEKRFRFTLVADSQGVVTLPRVRYPYFDPGDVQVRVAAAVSLSLPVLPGRAGGARRVLPVSAAGRIPFASRVVNEWWPALAVLLLAPLVVMIRRRPRRPAAVAPRLADSEGELRSLLGTPVDSAPDRITAALRRRGVARPDAESVRGWLAGAERRRWGPGVAPTASEPPAMLQRIIARLRRVTPWVIVLVLPFALTAQATVGVERYRAGDYPGAARTFEEVLRERPDDAVMWRNLASARSMAGDDVGAAAAWIRALELAPRDAVTRSGWAGGSNVPPEVRLLAPRIPVSRAELMLAFLLPWIVAVVTWRRRRTVALVAGFAALSIAVIGGMRLRAEGIRRALVRPAAMLQVSPYPTAPRLGDVPVWTLATVERSTPGWRLVRIPDGRRGWVHEARLAPVGTDVR